MPSGADTHTDTQTDTHTHTDMQTKIFQETRQAQLATHNCFKNLEAIAFHIMKYYCT